MADCIPVGGSLDDLREWWQTFAVPARQITSRWHEFPPGHRVRAAADAAQPCYGDEDLSQTAGKQNPLNPQNSHSPRDSHVNMLWCDS